MIVRDGRQTLLGQLCTFASASISSADHAEDIAQEAVIGGWEQHLSTRFNGDERRMLKYLLSATDHFDLQHDAQVWPRAGFIARSVASAPPTASWNPRLRERLLSLHLLWPKL